MQVVGGKLKIWLKATWCCDVPLEAMKGIGSRARGGGH